MSQDVWFRTVSIKWFPRIGACCALKSPMVPYTFDFQQNHKQVVGTNTCSFDTSNRYYYIYILTIHIFIYYVYITPDIWQQVSKVLSTKSLESLQQNEVLPVERDGHLPLDPMATWRARGGVLVKESWGSSTYWYDPC